MDEKLRRRLGENTERLVRERWAQGLRPEPMLTVSEWADKHRILTAKASAEAGRWRTDRTPYLREIMDSLSVSSPVERVVFMKGAQIGGSEAGNNFVGYLVHHAPGPALMVQPTVDTAKRYSKQRLGPMMEETPVLRSIVSAARSRDSGNTLLQKDYPGGTLILTGANSAAGLRSMPIRYLFLDEVDAYPDDADDEGDPVDLALKRTTTFVGRRKILLVSTPKLKDYSRIEQAFFESDQRRFLVPCQDCGVFGEIVWQQIKWEEGKPETAMYECHECGALHPEHLKEDLLRDGRWEAMAEGDGLTAGFHISSLYSPWETWGKVATEFLKVKSDPSRLQVWTNTALGETWEDQGGDQLDLEVIMGRREPFGELLHPSIVAITMGVDTQDDRLEYEIVGWGAEGESWSLEYEVIFGDPSNNKTWLKLDEVRRKRFAHSKAVADLKIDAVAIDSGGHHADDVLEYAHARRSHPVWAIKGHSDPTAPIWPAQMTRSNKNRRPMYVIGVNRGKDRIAARLRIEAKGPGYCHIPEDREETWFEQFTNEVVKTKYKNGRPIRYWIRKRDGDPVEAFDCRNYAYAALVGLERQKRIKMAERVAIFNDLPMKTAKNSAAEQQKRIPTAAQPKNRRRQSSYMSR